MATDLGADPAFVPAASSQQAISTKGFNPGEFTREDALAEIGNNIAHWLRYDRESREISGDPPPTLDSHIIPPFWPSYCQLCNWLDFLNPEKAEEARKAIGANQ